MNQVTGTITYEWVKIPTIGLGASFDYKARYVFRISIPPHEKLSATVRFLATGRSYNDLGFATLISKTLAANSSKQVLLFKTINKIQSPKMQQNVPTCRLTSRNWCRVLLNTQSIDLLQTNRSKNC